MAVDTFIATPVPSVFDPSLYHLIFEMDVDDFDFNLPADRVAQQPPIERGSERLLVVPLDGGPFVHTVFAALGRQAIVVNTSRGSVIRERDLLQALANGKIFACGLDVFEREPEIHPKLLGLKNVVLLPHLGSGTIEARTAMGDKVIITDGKRIGVGDPIVVEQQAQTPCPDVTARATVMRRQGRGTFVSGAGVSTIAERLRSARGETLELTRRLASAQLRKAELKADKPRDLTSQQQLALSEIDRGLAEKEVGYQKQREHARRIGDVLTIVLNENTAASKNADTTAAHTGRPKTGRMAPYTKYCTLVETPAQSAAMSRGDAQRSS